MDRYDDDALVESARILALRLDPWDRVILVELVREYTGEPSWIALAERIIA